MPVIATSRFNNETWQENCNYRIKKNITGCIYCSPCKISNKVLPDSLVFIIEMNNTTNKIEGIGLIRNSICFDKYYKVYDIGNYNRNIYKGDYRIDRSVIERYNSHILVVLDHILFKEKTHVKRGSGLLLFPDKLLKHKACEDLDLSLEIQKIFKSYFRNNKTETTENIEP